MKHNYFHYCISVQQGKGRGTASAEERNQERWQSRGQGRPRKIGEGRTHEMGKEKKKKRQKSLFTQEKALSASWLNWQKMSNLSETVRHVCFGFKQALGALVSIYILQIKKANFNIHWIWGSYLSPPPTQCHYLSPFARAGVTEGLKTPPYTHMHIVLNIFLHKYNFYTIYKNSGPLVF